ncbi:MICOS complex subunit MIC27 [Sinocyclocheilus anshuiensis]|uniref:MICOS complex subunit n=1 Tax=Sinocyclocheilus anshuiensis TaxID=1608454 RepID=A0A671MYH1_9TELE|nr:PREDICTED: MICOS complex subunit MIC27-like [Sinocyclocheilus anshuiensis]
MTAKILKYAALPAAAIAVGLGSFRIYSINEKINEELISPRELSIYSPDGPAVQFVEGQPGIVQTGLGAVRVGLQPYVRAVQSTINSVKVGVISVYHAGQDTYHFLRDPPPGFLPRVGVIGVSGLGGLILARKGSRLKRIIVPLGLATTGTAVCYPTQTVGVLKITGKKVYAVSSSVASIFKSKPKEDIITPAVSVESAATDTSSDIESPTKALSELPPESERATAVPDEDVTPIPQVIPSVDLAPVADVVSEDAVEPPPVVDEASGIAAPPSKPESPLATVLETALVTETTPEPVLDAESTTEPTPAPEPTPSAETDITSVVESENVLEAAPEIVVPAPTEATPSTPPTVEETTPPEDATPTTVDEGPASVVPPPAEEAIPLTPPPAEEAPPSSEPTVVEPATVKSSFVPDPSLLDHGQSNPEDADMYSTRS